VRSGEPVRRPVKLPLATYDVAVVDGRLVSDLVARPHRVDSPMPVPTNTR
jgi:hypothetical protein